MTRKFRLLLHREAPASGYANANPTYHALHENKFALTGFFAEN
jgi:hypothetical protein